MSSEKVNIASELAALQRALAEHERKAAAVKQAIVAKQKILREQVVSGTASTGDRITDFVFAVYGTSDEKQVAPWRELEQRLSGNTGQLLLLVRHTRDRHRFGGPGDLSENDYHLTTHLQLGLLVGEELVLNVERQEWGFPIGKATTRNGRRHMGDEIKEGPILFPHYEPVNSIGEHVHAGRQSGIRVEVFVGDEAALNRVGEDFEARMAIRRLGKELPETPEEIEAHKKEREEMREQLNVARDNLRARGSHAAREKLERLVERAKTECGLAEDPLVTLITAELVMHVQ